MSDPAFAITDPDGGLSGETKKRLAEKVSRAFYAIFEDPEERFYFDGPDEDTGYMLDTGNVDARTEGMSYGMMMAVQMNRRDLFDKLWTFSRRYMLQTDGIYRGYFAWSVRPDGTHNAEGPAPDGEEYFAMALFFAESRWGNDPSHPYGDQAREILRHCAHQQELVPGGLAMWDPDNHLVRFVPEADYSDPSYHLPHFYRLFSERADPEDRPFWRAASEASYAYLAASCHPVTGLAPEYADYSGAPLHFFRKTTEFYSDAYRVVLNIALDACWFGAKPELAAAVTRAQATLRGRPDLMADHSCLCSGEAHPIPVLHPLGLLATTAAGSLISRDRDAADWWLRQLLEAEPRTGNRRYYDNCLYFFSLLLLSGQYRIL